MSKVISIDQWLALGRDGLKLIGTYLALRGLTDDGTWTLISGALMTLVGVAGSYYANSRNAKIASTAALTGVRGVVTTAEIAQSITAVNVVSDPARVPLRPNGVIQQG